MLSSRAADRIGLPPGWRANRIEPSEVFSGYHDFRRRNGFLNPLQPFDSDQRRTDGELCERPSERVLCQSLTASAAGALMASRRPKSTSFRRQVHAGFSAARESAGSVWTGWCLPVSHPPCKDG